MKSKRNSLAGTKTGTSKSAVYFQNNPDAKKRKLEYDKKYQSSPERVNYREALNKQNRADLKSGKQKIGDKTDLSHTKSGKLVEEKQSSNRKRNGKGDNKRLK